MKKEVLNIDGDISFQNKKKIPVWVKLFYLSAAISALLLVAFSLSESFSDFFNKYISSIYRAFMAKLTGFIPFSFAEMIIILIPLIIIVILSYANKYYTDSWRNVGIFCVSVLSVLALFFTAFTVGFAPAYRGSSLDAKLGIERADVSAEELYETARILAEGVNAEAEHVAFVEGGFSIMPYGYSQMNDKLIDAYDKACDKYDFLQRLDSKLKPVMLSELMSYTHITGVYSFFTGEANINVAFPDYTIPYTAAHELAHQRGIAREDEANFVAFLVCM